MPKRPTKRRKISEKIPVSRQAAFEFCRRPSTLLIGGCLGLATILTVWGFQSDSNSVSDTDLTDEQLESDFLALGALGVSDSANPSSGSVQTQFNFDDETEADAPNLNSDSKFLNRATVSSATTDFEPPFDSDSPRFGRPIMIQDSSSATTIQQARFQQLESSYTTATGARVSANQAVWLTGSIETR